MKTENCIEIPNPKKLQGGSRTTRLAWYGDL